MTLYKINLLAIKAKIDEKYGGERKLGCFKCGKRMDMYNIKCRHCETANKILFVLITILI
jgi:hypothetical protein